MAMVQVALSTREARRLLRALPSRVQTPSHLRRAGKELARERPVRFEFSPAELEFLISYAEPMSGPVWLRLHEALDLGRRIEAQDAAELERRRALLPTAPERDPSTVWRTDAESDNS